MKGSNMKNSVEKVLAIYQFISEMEKSKNNVITDYKDYRWSYLLCNIPENKNYISLNTEIISGSEDSLLKVKKPEQQYCPKPPKELKEWLLMDWDNCDKELRIKESIVIDGETEYFKDSVEREKIFDDWEKSRNRWAKIESENKRIRDIFSTLYTIHNEFKADSESNELIIGNGIFTDEKNEKVNHPIITRRLKTVFDSENNTISLIDTDADPVLNTTFLQEVKGINNSSIGELAEDLKFNYYYPTSLEAGQFMKRFAHKISSDSEYIENIEASTKSRYKIINDPVIIVRKRISGTVNCIENIIEDIKETEDAPSTIIRFVDDLDDGIAKEYEELTLEEQLAASCGEDVDILLSKESNKEQLEIAKRIEENDAVTVQGPPGTGKTHTIANLIGHFLAQGKKILVTSHTKKALSVLKDMVEDGIKDLCVSMLEDSNKDMQISIENIIERRNRSSIQLKKESNKLQRERKEIINILNKVRRDIYSLKYKEQNTIVLNGESLSASKIAEFVSENREKLSDVIPGNVDKQKAFPLDEEEIKFLYNTNSVITVDDEKELNSKYPDIAEIIEPSRLKDALLEIENSNENIKMLSNEKDWNLSFDNRKGCWKFNNDNDAILKDITEEKIDRISEILDYKIPCEPWERKIAADAIRGGVYKKRWITLITCINNTCKTREEYLDISFGKNVKISKHALDFDETFKEIQKEYREKGKLTKIKLRLNSKYRDAINSIMINQNQINSESDCILVLKWIELIKKRNECAKYWDELFAENNGGRFNELDEKKPEEIAKNRISQIQKYISWGEKSIIEINNRLYDVGIDYKTLFNIDEHVTIEDEIALIDKGIKEILPSFIKLLKYINTNYENNNLINSTEKKLRPYKNNKGGIGEQLFDAISNKDMNSYLNSYNYLNNLIEKRDDLICRNELLERIKKVAPSWANNIKKRVGNHGEACAPDGIFDAWKWKQYVQIINEIILGKSFNDYINESVELSKRYRKITAELAEVNAWYHLLVRLESNNKLIKDLEGWRQTVKKIGKGTGKNAPKLKREARILMGQCQTAVPCWIMTINKAVETLKPSENKFDILIVDEASQADLTSLAIAYMAEKIIVVGDDKQVTPMGIGIDVDKTNEIAERTIKRIIPNWQLFDAKLSLYALAATTYQPIMLKEHFRCVPEIIGYSNKLSYDYKIKPLRDSSSSNIHPAIINYRVNNGKRKHNKTNPAEADTIIALMMACMEQEEYQGKSFGVISLLGDEQAKIINQKLIKHIEPIELEERRVLCGNASNFQGDERDVTFISLVDSSEDAGVLRTTGDGVEESTKKRYNVAVSRAKDQLWIVHSLDEKNDLSPKDIRKDLIDYAENPAAFYNKIESAKQKSDSPFEEDVIKRMLAKGYHIVQQWRVGAYSIDMVAIYKNNKIAIECDGERWHSGEEKIREDMERQAILERSGWKFIRIRGSEFYSDKEATIERVIQELDQFGIMPESEYEEDASRDTELLKKIKGRAIDILESIKSDNDEDIDYGDYQYALDTRKLQNQKRTPQIPKQKKGKDVIDTKGQGLGQLRIMFESEYEEDGSGNTIDILESIKSDNDEDIDYGDYQYALDTRKLQNQKRTPQIPKQKKGKDVIDTKGQGKTNSKKHPFDETILKKKPPKNDTNEKNKSSNNKPKKIVSMIQEKNWEYIDNSASSNIIYIIYKDEIKDEVTVFLKNLKYNSSLEKRGANATNNRKAWRIMIKKGEQR